MLFAPSQPSTKRPVNVCVPSMSLLPSTRRATTRTCSAVAGSGDCSSSTTSTPRRSSTRGCARTLARSSSSRSGWWNMFACGLPCGPTCRSRRNSAITRWRASSSRSPLAGFERARNPFAHPDPVQGTGHLVVQVHGAGQRVRPAVALQQGHRHAAVGEQQGRPCNRPARPRRRPPGPSSPAAPRHRGAGSWLSPLSPWGFARECRKVSRGLCGR